MRGTVNKKQEPLAEYYLFFITPCLPPPLSDPVLLFSIDNAYSPVSHFFSCIKCEAGRALQFPLVNNESCEALICGIGLVHGIYAPEEGLTAVT